MAILPGGLAGRTILVLLASVALVHVGSMLIYDHGVASIVEPQHTADIQERLDAAQAMLLSRPPSERPEVAALLSSPGFHLTWQPDGHATATLPAHRIVPHPGPMGAQGNLPLPDGSALQYRMPPSNHGGYATHLTLLSTTVMVLGVVLVAGLLVRGMVAPLRRLAQAADAIGHTVDPAPIAETGSDEVRQVAHAFNAMQERIGRLVHDRTHALAAVSHDLRTPITRLRLRAAFVADHDVQASIDRDLDEMEAMIEATLAYLSGSAEAEAPRPTDLPAMLATLVDAATDAGKRATYAGPGHLTALVPPLGLKRAFANLIDNAIIYGGCARVRLALEGDQVLVEIEDDGPGIPPGDAARVFEPFVRLEQSRNRGTGGVGLGLPIARQVVTAAGGQLALVNRAGGGLTARVELPKAVLTRTQPKERPDDDPLDDQTRRDRSGKPGVDGSGTGGDAAAYLQEPRLRLL